VLTGTVCRASKRSLIVRCTVSGQVPCSGAKRRNKGLDEVSTAIHGGEAAVNGWDNLMGLSVAKYQSGYPIVGRSRYAAGNSWDFVLFD